VARIMADYVESLVFLYPTAEAARANEDSGGSGFLLGVEYAKQPEHGHVYVITNAHVSDNSQIVRLLDQDGQPQILDLSEKRWLAAPEDDVALCSLSRSAPFSGLSMVRASSMLTEGELEDDTATYRSDHPHYGDEVFMASRLISDRLRDGSVPTVRFGTLASSQPAAVDHDRGYYQDSFLVEMRSIPGHSGSPVFLHYNDATLHIRQGFRTGPVPLDIRLLGIDWGHLPPGKSAGQPSGAQAWNAGIACVVPSWKIAELLADEGLVRERKKAERD
jgi:Trypsin-like peptidase domain